MVHEDDAFIYRGKINGAHAKILAEVDRLAAALKDEREQSRKLIVALRKYADPNTHSMDEDGFTWSGDYFDYETARRALAGYEAGE